MQLISLSLSLSQSPFHSALGSRIQKDKTLNLRRVPRPIKMPFLYKLHYNPIEPWNNFADAFYQQSCVYGQGDGQGEMPPMTKKLINCHWRIMRQFFKTRLRVSVATLRHCALMRLLMSARHLPINYVSRTDSSPLDGENGNGEASGLETDPHLLVVISPASLPFLAFRYAASLRKQRSERQQTYPVPLPISLVRCQRKTTLLRLK